MHNIITRIEGKLYWSLTKLYLESTIPRKSEPANMVDSHSVDHHLLSTYELYYDYV